jgi:hypothetical protein
MHYSWKQLQQEQQKVIIRKQLKQKLLARAAESQCGRISLKANK